MTSLVQQIPTVLTLMAHADRPRGARQQWTLRSWSCSIASTGPRRWMAAGQGRQRTATFDEVAVRVMRRAAQRHLANALLVVLCSASVSLAAVRWAEPAGAGRAQQATTVPSSLAEFDPAFVPSSPDRIARMARALAHRWTPLPACVFLGLLGLGGAIARRAGGWPDRLNLTPASTREASPRAPPSFGLAASH